MKINAEDVEKHLETFMEWNSVNIKDVQLYRDGNRVYFDMDEAQTLSRQGFPSANILCHFVSKK